MVSAITKDGSKIYVALNDQELADLQRGETLIVPGDLLDLPYAIAVVSAGAAPTELEEVARMPNTEACGPLSPAMLAALARGVTLRCESERLPTLLLCVGGSQTEMQAAIIEASRGRDIIVRIHKR